MNISVVICTHNPRPDYLERVLDGLKGQSLSYSEWELIIVDNVSDEILMDKVDLSWHRHGRHVRESELGLTPARLRGITESAGELIVFVDDDNVLAKDYLEQSLKLHSRYPFLGAYSGTCEAEFDMPPESWADDYVCMLAIRDVERSAWEESYKGPSSMPYGAGLVVSRDIANEYLEKVKIDPMRQSLDRKGGSLLSCGDLDLAMTSYSLRKATGLFPELKLKHLIPSSRLEVEYLLKLRQGMSASTYLFEYLHTGKLPPRPLKPWSSPGRLLLWYRSSRLQRKMMQANEAAKQLALDMIKSIKD